MEEKVVKLRLGCYLSLIIFPLSLGILAMGGDSLGLTLNNYWLVVWVTGSTALTHYVVVKLIGVIYECL